MDLYQALLKNEDQAFAQLYQQCFAAVKSYICLNSGTADDAKDCFQDGIIALWQNVHSDKYTHQSDNLLIAYLVKICKFRWLERTKSTRFKNTVEISEELHLELASESELDQMIRSEEIAQRVSIFNRLEDKCKKILELFYYEKKSMVEIGAAMGYATNSAKNEKYRCIEKLKALHQPNKI